MGWPIDGSTGCSTNVEHPPETAAKSSTVACMACERRGAGAGVQFCFDAFFLLPSSPATESAETYY